MTKKLLLNNKKAVIDNTYTVITATVSDTATDNEKILIVNNLESEKIILNGVEYTPTATTELIEEENNEGEIVAQTITKCNIPLEIGDNEIKIEGNFNLKGNTIVFDVPQLGNGLTSMNSMFQGYRNNNFELF